MNISERVKSIRQHLPIIVAVTLLALVVTVSVVVLCMPIQAIRPVNAASAGMLPADCVLSREFRVDCKLPQGAVINYWVDYYLEGERTDLAIGSVTLQQETRNLAIHLELKEHDEEQEMWSISVGGEQTATCLPKSPRGGRWINLQRTKFKYGTPVTLAVGVLSTNEIITPRADAFTDEGLLPWLQNPVVYVLRVQIDLPTE